jgi:hypothetical protein
MSTVTLYPNAKKPKGCCPPNNNDNNDFVLPENPEEGDLLGWEDGKLDWVKQQIVEARADSNLKVLANTIMLDRNIDWKQVNGTPFGNAVNGASFNFANRQINISAGNTGKNTTFSQYITLTGNVRKGDKVFIRVGHMENVLYGTEKSNLTVDIYEDNVKLALPFNSVEIASKVFEHVFEYIFDKFTVLEARISIGSNAEQVTTLTVFTIEAVSTYYENDKILDAIKNIDTDLRKIAKLYPFYERSSVISKVDTTNTVDNSVRLQDELDRAVDVSGRIIFPSNASIRLTNSVTIKGSVELRGFKTKFSSVLQETGKAQFLISTVQPFIFNGISAQRETNLVTDFIKFNPLFPNVGSKFLNCTVINFPTHLSLNYCSNIEITDCLFSYGQKAIVIGDLDNTVKNIKIKGSKFENIAVTGIESSIAQNLSIKDNLFAVHDTEISIYMVNNIVIFLTTGIHSNLDIIDNKSNVFSNYAVIISVANGSTLKDVNIVLNRFRDGSPAKTGTTLSIIGNNGNVDSLHLTNNKFRNKQIAVYMSHVKNAIMTSNLFKREDDPTNQFNLSRGYSINNSTYLPDSNLKLDQLNPDILTNNTILTAS